MRDDSLDRRGFLRRGATATLLALLSEQGLSAGRASADDEPFAGRPVNCAVVGLGPWGREIVTALSRLPSATVAGLCDAYPPALKRVAAMAPKAVATADYRTLLASPDIEALVVATPSHLHKDVAIAALQSGKHVYCEAPLASSIDDARAIAAVAKAAATVVFASGLQGRSNSLYRHVWSFVKSGVLGEVAVAKAQWNRKESWRRPGPNPQREAVSNWRLGRATSAGLPGEIGIHHFDLATAFLATPPLAVTGAGSVIQWRDGREVPDTVDCAFDYPGGVRAVYTATLASSFGGSHAVFQGSSGSLFLRERRAWLIKEADAALLGWEVHARKEPVLDDTGIALVADATRLLAAGKEPGNEASMEPEQDALSLALDNFARSVRGQATPLGTAADGLLATVVAIKAHEATLAGARLEIKPDSFTV